MNCGDMPDTGGPRLLILLALAGIFLLAGALVLLLVRARTRRSARAAGAVLLVLVGGGLGGVNIPESPAQATTPDCITKEDGSGTDHAGDRGGDQSGDPGGDQGSSWPPNSLTITQTSTMTGLAPGIDPAAITGKVVNNGYDSTYITAITVSIVSVTKAPRAPAGRCDASDYLLLTPRMSVAQMLGANESTNFAGASIGFNNKSTNQDACKNATIDLQYAAS